MKQIKDICMIMFILFAMASCGDTKNNALIIGDWSGAEWLIDGRPSDRDIQNTGFHFDSSGNYIFNYQETKEQGTYKIENDMLFTTATGKNEIMVKISKLTKDSLVFNMNNGGQGETLVLIKK